MELATRSAIQAGKSSADQSFINTEAAPPAHASNPAAQQKIDAVAQSAPDYAQGEKIAAASSELSQGASLVVAAYGGPVALASFGIGMAAGQVGQNLAQALHADEYAAAGLEALGMHRIGHIPPQGPNPARIGDPIAHSFAAAGLLATVVLGAIAAVAVAALVVATGGAAAIAMMGAAAAGGLVGGFAGASLGNALAQMGTVTGAILKGSTDVFIEGKPAARMTDIAACAKEPAPVALVEGSETVFVNGLPLARVGHKLLCGAVVDKGASKVFTDNTTQACAQAAPDVPVWLRVAVDWIGFLPVGAAAAKAGRFAKRTVSRVRRGNQSPAKCCVKGEPVNVITGAYYEQRTDLLIPGSLALAWVRSYNSNHLAENPSLFGTGYSDSFSICLRRDPDGNLAYWDADGQCLVFHTPEFHLQAGHLLAPELLLCGTQQEPRLLNLESGISHHFAWFEGEEHARLYKVSDEAGNYYQLHYSFAVQGGLRLAAITHSDGYRLLCHWQESAEACSLSLTLEEAGEAAQEVLRYGFEQHAGRTRLIRCNSDASGHMCYAYNAQGRLASWWDSDATRVHFEYDNEGRIGNVHTPGHILATRFAYEKTGDGSRTWMWMRDAQGVEGAPSLFEANADGLLMRATNPIGQVQEQSWDDNQNLSAEWNASARRDYQYDHQGRLLRVKDSQGTVHNLKYDERGRLCKLTDNHGRSTIWQYGTEHPHLQEVRQESEGQSRSTRYTWRTDGLLEAVEAGGRSLHYAYDEHKRPCGQTLTNGACESWEQNRLGRIYRHTDALGLVTRFEYAAPDTAFGPIKHEQSQPLRVHLANGDRLEYAFDHEGRITRQVDASGAVRGYEWGPFDLLLAEIDPCGQRTAYRYDWEARLQCVTNALQQSWEFERDAAGQLLREVDFQGREQRYEYDSAGRLLRKSVAAQVQTDYAWDQAGRLQQMQSGAIRIDFSYDQQGRMRRARRWHGELLEAENLLEYDAWGALRQDTQNGAAMNWLLGTDGLPQASSHPYARSRWDYDALGRVRSLQLGSGEIYLQRDALGRETGRANLNLFAQNAKLVAAQALVPHFHLQQSYDALGQMRQQSLLQADLIGQTQPGRQKLRDYTWQHGRLQEVDDARFGRVRYQHDAQARVLHSEYERGPLACEHFSYDALGDTAAAHCEIRPGYADKAQNSSFGMGQWRQLHKGRVSTLDHHGVRQTCHYDEAGRLLEKVETRPGFRPRHWRYTWDGFDRLLALHSSDGQVWYYAYDAFGRRIRKTCIQAGSSGGGKRQLKQEECIWDGARLAVQKKSWQDASLPAGQELRQEVFVWHYEGQSFKPLALEYQRNEDKPELLHLITDQIGTLREAVNGAGEVVWAAQSQTWGQLQQTWHQYRVIPLPWSTRAAANEEWIQLDLRQPNQWQDAESGLFYNYQRYYDPQLGHYLSSDPIGLAGGMRAHGYVDNPLVWMDPLGLSGCNRVQEVRELFDKKHARNYIEIDGKSIVEAPNNGNAKIFSGVSEAQVKQYFQELTGVSQLPTPRNIPGKGSLYSVNVPEGNFTLRDFSSSSSVTGPAWTIDIPKGVSGTTYNPEIKFLK